MERIELKDIRGEHFQPLEGQVFEFETAEAGSDPRRWRMELVEVNVPRRRRRRNAAEGSAPEGRLPQRDPFSLLFRNLESEPMNDIRLYRLRCEAFQTEAVLLSRVVVPYREPGEMYYEAVFG